MGNSLFLYRFNLTLSRRFLGLVGLIGLYARALPGGIAFTPQSTRAGQYKQQPANRVFNVFSGEFVQLRAQLWPHGPQLSGVGQDRLFDVVGQQVLRGAVGHAFASGFVGAEQAPEDVADRRFWSGVR